MPGSLSASCRRRCWRRHDRAQGARCVPPSEFGGAWPQSLPVQVHGMDADEIFVDEGDLDAARALVDSTADAELFLYPGDQHLFADDSLSAYDEQAASLLTDRVLAFLDGK